MELVNTNFNLFGGRNRHQQIVFFLFARIQQILSHPMKKTEKLKK
jgi:hypothetical protein